MKYDGEFAFFAGLFGAICVIAVCFSVCYGIKAQATVEYAQAGLQECFAEGAVATTWKKDCK